MKVLLFSNDLMPFGELPTSGGGLRCWQLMKGLESAGIEVIVSMPGFTYLAEKHYAQIPEAQREYLWRWETQDEILRRVKPDAVYFASNWDHYGLSGKLDIPLIIDLHGSRLIETTMWNAPVSTDRKVEILSKADCLTTAGIRQRLYFYGWLVQAGRVPSDEHFIRYIPISLGPERAERNPLQPHDSDFPQFVSGGGWFPWQNQSRAIVAACRNVKDRGRGAIEIFGTPHETSSISAEERQIRDIYANVQNLASECDRIRVHGYVGRNDLLKIYSKASVALETMRYNLERELAFTTRTVEYLWCGLPVLYNNYAELSSHIAEYDAGWTVDPDSDDEIAAAIDEIFSSPDIVATKGRNAQRLVEDRFTWDKTIAPLVDFLKSPKMASKAEPAVGKVYSLPSFLVPRGALADVPLYFGSSLRQSFVMPAEQIRKIEIPFERRRAEAGAPVSEMTLTYQLTDDKGRKVAHGSSALGTLPERGELTIAMPTIRQPLGGTELSLELSLSGPMAPESAGVLAPVVLKGSMNPSFPFLPGHRQPLRGTNLLGEEVDVQALALTFLPGESKLLHLKTLGERALRMVKAGEWKRLVRAIKNRLPGAVRRVLGQPA